ncbi:putative sulfate exporter family transporter [Olivibacter sp. SDN3]|uniref:YeiH family protein n=1 Tax=Olivibacter sp. SDN3 TaxID=2764720 RepID=UPI001651ACC1|nr:putative sulfate exporter family transporter [Olivibacter sp. SDN3]QNL50405.1 putative sulfate exporter family transporter [Olivibacter sp. SDN3]
MRQENVVNELEVPEEDLSAELQNLPKKNYLTEDWTVVILGAIIIVSAIAGLHISAPQYKWSDLSGLLAVFSLENSQRLLLQFLFTFAILIFGALLTGRKVAPYLKGFPVVFILTVVALLFAGNASMEELGLEAVIFSLCIGLLIGNTVKLPVWLKESLSAELLVKIGLVLLGTSVIFSDILKAGSLGLIQSLVVVLSVWYFAFWLCKKFKIDEELGLMLSSAVSICGVSAAIATSGAIQGDSKKLSYVVSMVLITAVPMMIGMPYIASYFGFSEEVTGAWLGGSIDTSGAVVASGSLVGETALKISTIVKFSQNVLLGVAALAISIYWTYTNHPAGQQPGTKPGLGVIWERFPKFVLGFIAASLLFSFVLSEDTIATVKGDIKSIQSLWFALAFTSIGLETNFKELIKENSKRPFWVFLIAQLFNIIITLILAFLLFG